MALEDEDRYDDRPTRRRGDDDRTTHSREEDDGYDNRPRRPSGPKGDATGGIIPYKNITALLAYYCGVFALIPGIGLLLGPIGIVLGFLGLKHKKKHPESKGTGHAITGIVLGTLATLGNLLGIVLIFAGVIMAKK